MSISPSQKIPSKSEFWAGQQVNQVVITERTCLAPTDRTHTHRLWLWRSGKRKKETYIHLDQKLGNLE